MPEGAEADREIEVAPERQSPDVGPHQFRVRIGAPRLIEHARTEIDTGNGPPAQRPENFQPGAGAAANVHSPAERPAPGKHVGGRVENRLGRAEWREVELRRKKV